MRPAGHEIVPYRNRHSTQPFDKSIRPLTPNWQAPLHPGPKIDPGATEEMQHGRRDGEPDVRLLGGYFIFDSCAPPLGVLRTLHACGGRSPMEYLLA